MIAEASFWIEGSVCAEWAGREWQDYCVLLLRRRCATTNPHSLQLVPDRHQGDLGIEAFSHDGAAYQCYAAEGQLGVKDRYEKQRDKLTTDLRKLAVKKDEVAALLGSVVLHHYVFMVPVHDSRHLITHAHAQAEHVKGLGLPFIADDFVIVIETADDYAAEQTQIHAIPLPLVEAEPPSEEDTKGWAEGNQDLRQTALAKLEAVTDSTATRDAVFDALVGQFLQGENALQRIREAAPDGYRNLVAKKAHQEGLLVLKYSNSNSSSSETLTQIADDVGSELLAVNPLIGKSLAETLAWSSVADWLMRCPLDFPSESSDA